MTPKLQVSKEIDPVAADADITAKTNMLFSSTAVCNGSAGAPATQESLRYLIPRKIASNIVKETYVFNA